MTPNEVMLRSQTRAELEGKRMELARVLFSSQTYAHPKSNAASVLQLAGELLAIASKL